MFVWRGADTVAGLCARIDGDRGGMESPAGSWAEHGRFNHAEDEETEHAA